MATAPSDTTARICLNPPSVMPEYLDRAANTFEGKMTATPNAETIPFKADTAGVIGFYSR